jgi:TPR repeat protein
VAKDLVASQKWAEKGTNQGNDVGQLNLVMCYYHGQGVAKDCGAAREWLEKSAGQGNGDAQLKLGEIMTNEERGEQPARKEPVLVDKAPDIPAGDHGVLVTAPWPLCGPFGRWYLRFGMWLREPYEPITK